MPAGVSHVIAGYLMNRNTRTIRKMLDRGTLTRTDDRHVAIASVAVLLGHEITTEAYGLALARQRSLTNREGRK